MLGGESLALCVRWLEGADLPEEQRPRFHTPRGGKWATLNLGAMLRSPLLAGIRTVGQNSTRRNVAPGTWPAVVELETHEALVRLLGDPARRTAKSDAVRSTCSRGSRSAPAGRCCWAGQVGGSRNTPCYACSTGRHVYRRTEPVDDAVTEAVIARLELSDSTGAFVDESAEAKVAELTVKRDALVARRKTYAAKAAAGEIDDDDGCRRGGADQGRSGEGAGPARRR